MQQVLELVNLSWLAFVQIPRGQMGKNKYQKATASQRNARCVIFRDLFDLFGLLQNRPLDFDSFDLFDLGLHGGVQIQGSCRQLWKLRNGKLRL